MVRVLAVAPWMVVAACGQAPPAVEPDVPPEAPRTCLAPAADRAGTTGLDDALGSAQVEVTALDPCTRRYVLSSTAARRDNLPAGPREIDEAQGSPRLRSGHDLLDALYALALAEAREASVAEIRDGAFAQGSAIPCPEGGCFETGRLWTYVWTRDISYATDLGLASVDPRRARNSLEFKLSRPRTGGPEHVVQDTGSGGSYPVSTDRVVWALGAAAAQLQLDGAERDAFRARAYAALVTTVEHDREVIHDANERLYFGEQSFLDWREQSYPAWTAGDVAPIASSKALSTNLAHLRALELVRELAPDDAAARRYGEWADALRAAIRDRFWIEDAGLFSAFVTTYLDPAPARQFDLLGNALAIVHGVATRAQAERVVSSYPHVGPGAAPVVFPQQQQTAIYHNRAEWPFVTAYWLRAAVEADHPTAAAVAIRSLVRAAALNLSNMENLEIASGAPWVDDGAYSGPVVNSHRQLWSVGGFVSLVHHTLFGVRYHDDAIEVVPYVPGELRDSMFRGTPELILDGLMWRGRRIAIVLHLPPPGTAGGSDRAVATVERRELNGVTIDGAIAFPALEDTNRIDVFLADGVAATKALTRRDPTSWREVFGPRVPMVTGVRREGDSIAIDLAPGGEDPLSVRYAVYRDGTAAATQLAGTETTFIDPSASTSASACYAIETCFVASGTCSQRSRPVCWWGDGGERVSSIPASAFVAVGGVASNDHGRFHYGTWGDAGDTLVVPSYQPTRSGLHLLQVVYGNGAGSVSTGVACGVKRVVVEDTATGVPVASGVLVMPQTGSWSRWADSTFVPATLDAARTYRITISSDRTTLNMSALSHFTHYAGTGGAGGEFAHVNIAELKILAR